MDLLATIKLVIGITGTDKDDLLVYYLNGARDRLGEAAGDYSVVNLAVQMYNKRGIEGAKSHAGGDVVTTLGDNAFDIAGSAAGGGSQPFNIIPWNGARP